MADLYKLFSKRDVKLTISCGNEFFIKNYNDVNYIFSIHQEVESIYLLVKDYVDNLVLSIIISFGWNVCEVQVGAEAGSGDKVEENVGGQVGGKVRG